MPIDQETIAAIAAMVDQKLAVVQQPQPVQMMPAQQIQGAAFAAPFGAPATASALAPQALLLPVKVPTPDGREVSALLMFGPGSCQDPQAILMAVQQAMMQYPITAYAPKQQGNWGNGGQQQAGWGGNNNGGGYNRGGGGGYGRRW